MFQQIPYNLLRERNKLHDFPALQTADVQQRLLVPLCYLWEFRMNRVLLCMAYFLVHKHYTATVAHTKLLAGCLRLTGS